jgi:hypothetical protein
MKKKPSNGRAKPKKKETLRQIYARVKREFSAADLQKYTVDEPMIPADQVLAELEEISAKWHARRRNARRRKP